MTLGQVEALCRGIVEIERADMARRVGLIRLAMHGSDADVDAFLQGQGGRDDDAELDAILKLCQEGAADG